MKNQEGFVTNPKPELKLLTNGNNRKRYAPLIARRCTHRDNKIEPVSGSVVQQNGECQSIARNCRSQSAPSGLTKTHRLCCAPLSTGNPEKLVTTSEPTSPRRKGRVLLRQSALETSKESLHEYSNHYHDDKETVINNSTKKINRVTKNKSIRTCSKASTKSIYSQTKSHKSSGNNGNGTTKTGGGQLGGGKCTISSSTNSNLRKDEVGQRRQLGAGNGHGGNNSRLTTIARDKDAWNSKMDSSCMRRLTVLKPSCVSSQPTQAGRAPPLPKVQLQLRSPRKRLEDPRSISTTTTTTIHATNLSVGQESRKLISRETTVLFPNGLGKNSTHIQEPRFNIKQLTKSSSPWLANENSRSSKVSTTSSTSGLGCGRISSLSKPKHSTGCDTDTKNTKTMGSMEMDTTAINEEENMRAEPLLKFLEPMEPNLEIVEGSDLELTVVIQGANKVVWVKNDKVVPNIPPDFEYKSNPKDGIFSLKIQDAFIEDSGLYICEVYGSDEESDAICWCRVEVVEEVDEDDTSIELEEISEPQPPRRFIVPLIITSDASEDCINPNVEIMDPVSPAGEKRLNFKEIRDTSTNSSRDVFEDAVEEQHHDKDNNLQKPSRREGCRTGKVQINGELSTSPKEKITNGDDSTMPLSELNLTANNDSDLSQISPLKSSDNVNNDLNFGSSCDQNQLCIEERRNLIDTTYSDCNVSDFEFEALDKTSCSTDISIPNNTDSDAQEDTDSSLLSSSEKHDVTDSPIDQEILRDLSFFNSSLQSPSRTCNVLDLTPDSERQFTDLLKSEEVFDTTLESCEMVLCSTMNESSPTQILEDLNRSEGSAEMSLSTTYKSHDLETSPITGEMRNPQLLGKSFTSQSSTESSGSETFNSLSLDEMLSSNHQSSQNVGHASSHTKQLQSRDSFTDQLPPRVLIGPSNLIAILGETVNLRVKIQSTDEANTVIDWCKFVRGIYRKLGPRLDSEEPEDTSSHVQIKKVNRDLITLSITDVNYEDSGKYRVKVQNLFGIDYHHCMVSVEGPPEPPATPPKAKYDKSTNAILISWHSCPYDGGSAVTGFCLEASLLPMDENNADLNGTDDKNWLVLTPPSFKWLCFTLESPKPAQRYRFRVSVENAYGKGRPSRSSNGLVINSLSGLSQGGPGNPDRTVSLVYNYNPGCEWPEPAYEYREVSLKHESFLQHYDKFEQLGKGRFGVVFKVTNKETKKSYAGKFVKCIKAKDKERTQLEYKIMNELKYHPKLICLVDAFEMPREIVIVTEMINGGELFERVVADDFTLTEHDCIAFLRQICDGVHYIHQMNIMHLDLKPENILCTTKNSNQIKIIDFGLAQKYNPNDPISVLFGTAEFVSPEIINYDTICPATDMWSIGVITYILLSGLSPFLGDNDNETFSNITRGEFDFEDDAFDNISEEAKDFISNLIIKRKEKRLTALQCLQHQWLALSDAEKKDIVLPTEKLKRFLVRRKWQKTGNAIRALGRITTLYSSRKSSGSSSTSSSSPLGILGQALHKNLSTQDSGDYDSVFSSIDGPLSPDVIVEDTDILKNFNTGSNTIVSSPTSTSPPLESENLPDQTETNKPKYNDSSRSDSGVCDVASTSATPTPQE